VCPNHYFINKSVKLCIVTFFLIPALKLEFCAGAILVSKGIIVVFYVIDFENGYVYRFPDKNVGIN
jgi:hypothetical protein